MSTSYHPGRVSTYCLASSANVNGQIRTTSSPAETPRNPPAEDQSPHRRRLRPSGMVQPLDLKLQTSLNPLDTEDSHLRPARTAAEETPVPTCSAKPIVDFNHFLSAQVCQIAL